MSGADIAAEIAEALAEAGQEVGSGEYLATLRQAVNTGDAWAPTQTTTDTTITVLDFNRRVMDNAGTLIGQTRRTLMVAAFPGLVISKGDTVALSDGVFHEITEVRPLAPGGTTVLWDLDLAT